MDIFNQKDGIEINNNLAVLTGLEESIILIKIHKLILINTEKNQNFKQGYFWVAITFEQLHKQLFEIYSVKTIKKYIKKLENRGLIISDNYNPDVRYGEKWYRIDYQKLNELKSSK